MSAYDYVTCDTNVIILPFGVFSQYNNFNIIFNFIIILANIFSQYFTINIVGRGGIVIRINARQNQ